MRKFRKVAKTKKGTPKKYLSGAKNPKAKEEEIKSTAAKYKRGEFINIQEVSKSRASQSKTKSKTNKRKNKSRTSKKGR
ncbi:hypothetical protein [uncultured Mediterranean phage uvMED]|nr:hypothetical protein [uncultured phage MedDCM-OCT-S04-C64]BAQ88885.1 hypothetical protein [uncultured Mediterranean phage uvMED]BAQ88945.1 hypothetical protein [uncultured Mediterranean phage uvMED]